MSERTKYSVYQHIFPNGYVYTGITCRPLWQRWGNGNGYKSNKIMYKNIEKFGWENIKHNVIAEGISRDEAQAIEKRLIAESGKKTYNVSRGGTGVSHSYLWPEVNNALNRCAAYDLLAPWAKMYKSYCEDMEASGMINTAFIIASKETREKGCELQLNDIVGCALFIKTLSRIVMHPEDHRREVKVKGLCESLFKFIE